ncbi:MAG TPA: DUF3017 domain-containing protein [Streptosporangiaceae bacterium]|jgi:Protein of unknown function (DUF3017)|nr:DUF3017 domain-containing protein [Streptosporangiaceae bacterium]
MAEMRRRRRTGPDRGPRRLAQLPYTLVLCGVVAGLTMVALNHFKRGSALVAVAVLLGAVARMVLPESRVGMLATRKKTTDVIIMVGFAIGIAVVAYIVPPPKT